MCSSDRGNNSTRRGRGMPAAPGVAAAKLVLLAVLPCALTLNAAAHHSRVEFAGEVQELEGTLLEVIWLNPHPALFVETLDDSGAPVTWRVEAHTGVRVYNRMGVTPDLFEVGETIKVAGRVSTRRDRHLLGLNVLLADDTVVRLSRDDPPYWEATNVIGTEGAVPFNEVALRNAATEGRGLFRVWSAGPGGRSQNLPYTQAAIDGRAGWHPADNAVARCEQPGMPVTMGAPLPIRFIDEGDTLTLHAVYFDTRRTIHMNAAAAEADRQPSSHLGFSVGRWEDSTLIVETTRINYPWVDNEARTPQSSNVMTTERFSLSDDHSRLDYELVITDPVTFTEPATRTRTYLALDEPFDVLDCHVF